MADSLKSDTEGVFKPYYQQNQRIGPLLMALGLLRASTLAQPPLLLFYIDMISKRNCLLDLIVDLTNLSCAKVELDCSSSSSKQLLRMPSQRSYVSAKKKYQNPSSLTLRSETFFSLPACLSVAWKS